MTKHRMKRLLGLLATLAASAVLAAGCGDDDGGGGIDGGGGNSIGGETSGSGDDAPADKEKAIENCYEDARKLEGQDRETAEAGCRAADTGDTDELKKETREQCRETAKQIPDEAARKQVEASCEQLGQ